MHGERKGWNFSSPGPLAPRHCSHTEIAFGMYKCPTVQRTVAWSCCWKLELVRRRADCLRELKDQFDSDLHCDMMMFFFAGVEKWEEEGRERWACGSYDIFHHGTRGPRLGLNRNVSAVVLLAFFPAGPLVCARASAGVTEGSWSGGVSVAKRGDRSQVTGKTSLAQESTVFLAVASD